LEGNWPPPLATVGQTLRDRIEISRHIQSNFAQLKFFTFASIAITCFIAALALRNSSEQMREFVNSHAGGTLVVGSLNVSIHQNCLNEFDQQAKILRERNPWQNLAKYAQ
jgi:hypothetical protein